MTRSQNVYTITDRKFAPSTPEEVALFEEKQAFLYTAFVTTLKLDMAKHLSENILVIPRKFIVLLLQK